MDNTTNLEIFKQLRHGYSTPNITICTHLAEALVILWLSERTSCSVFKRLLIDFTMFGPVWRKYFISNKYKTYSKFHPGTQYLRKDNIQQISNTPFWITSSGLGASFSWIVSQSRCVIYSWERGSNTKKYVWRNYQKDVLCVSFIHIYFWPEISVYKRFIFNMTETYRVYSERKC
jgi:hypothetical protein